MSILPLAILLNDAPTVPAVPAVGLALFLVDGAVLERADDYLAVLKHFR